MRRHVLSVLLLTLAIAGSGATAAWPDAPRLAATDGRFALRAADGTTTTGQRLVGTTFDLSINGGAPLTLRIDEVVQRSDPGLELYHLAVRDADGRWRAHCRPDPDGRTLAVPLSDQSNGGFRITCMAGAEGKCLMRGYLPWQKTQDGSALAPYFEACVRMLRADYCGDGTSFTRAGIRVAVSDRLGLHRDDLRSSFEAAWGPDGAVCITRTRVPALASLAKVIAHCPALASRVRDDCSPRTTGALQDALLWNQSLRRR